MHMFYRLKELIVGGFALFFLLGGTVYILNNWRPEQLGKLAFCISGSLGLILLGVAMIFFPRPTRARAVLRIVSYLSLGAAVVLLSFLVTIWSVPARVGIAAAAIALTGFGIWRNIVEQRGYEASQTRPLPPPVPTHIPSDVEPPQALWFPDHKSKP